MLPGNQSVRMNSTGQTKIHVGIHENKIIGVVLIAANCSLGMHEKQMSVCGGHKRGKDVLYIVELG